VLHSHSASSTVISRLATDEVVLEGYEMLKAFDGVVTHESRVVVPVVDNDQDIPRLAERVKQLLDDDASMVGYLIRGHGLYAWGATVGDARRHIEAFEFLFDCELRAWRPGAR